MPQIEVHAGEIRQIAGTMRCAFDDEHRVRALTCSETQDVQAAPGSGKTTLLVAKLAVLTSKWREKRQGMCVLSHTNVAKYEIQEGLVGHANSHRLLSYPHFVGTIQAFAHQFLALPYVRGRGIEVVAVDDELFAAKMRRMAAPNVSLQSYLARQQNGDDILTGVRFTSPGLNIESAGGNLPGADTQTYRSLLALKWRIANEGVFRYDDMYALAHEALLLAPSLAAGLTYRFPIVFIDEMQDTNLQQDALLQMVFRQDCVVQRFGDCNQAIFRGGRTEESQASFPRQGFIDLPDSRRFGTAIAGFASPLAIVAPQQLVGNPARPNLGHTVFLFDEATIGRVIPAFAQLIVREFPQARRCGLVAKAIGGRKTGNAQTAPRHIGDYWRGYTGAQAGATYLQTLLEYLRRARHHVAETGAVSEAVAGVWRGLIDFLEFQRVVLEVGGRLTKSAVLRSLAAEGERKRELKELIRSWCLEDVPQNEADWRLQGERLRQVFGPIIGVNALTPEADEFLSWVDAGEAVDEPVAGSANIYGVDVEGAIVNVEVATVHRVKGETHDATLVLETQLSQVFDLREAIPFLIGNGNPRRLQKATVKRQFKVLYVAMTRPSSLLCLALRHDHVSVEQRAALAAAGWRISDLTV